MHSKNLSRLSFIGELFTSYRVKNVFLRMFSMGIRLLLVVFLAKLLTPGELGSFGIMSAALAFNILLIGADYYVYSNREILSVSSKLERGRVIQGQITAYALLYFCVIPIQILLFVFFEWKDMGWFLLLLITEHIGQELVRLLVVFNRQLTSSIVLFIRSALWVIIVLPILYFIQDARDINTVYAAWAIGGLLAILYGVIEIKRHIKITREFRIDSLELKKGLKLGGFFLIATLSIKAIFYLDKIIIDSNLGLEELGGYVFYMTIVIGAFSIIDPMIFSFIYPNMTKNYQDGSLIKYRKNFRDMAWGVIVLALGVSIVVFYITPFVVDWIDRPTYRVYGENIKLFILIGVLIQFGNIYHYGLYAIRADKWNVYSQICALILFIIMSQLLFQVGTVKDVLVMIIASLVLMNIMKIYGYLVTYGRSE